MRQRCLPRSAFFLVACLILALAACTQAAPSVTPLPTVTPIPPVASSRGAAPTATTQSGRPAANVPTGLQVYIGEDLHDPSDPTIYLMQWTDVGGSLRGQGDVTNRQWPNGHDPEIVSQQFTITGQRNGSSISLTIGLIGALNGTLSGNTLTLVIFPGGAASPYNLVLHASNQQEYEAIKQRYRAMYVDAIKATATASQALDNLELIKRVSGRWEVIDGSVVFNTQGGVNGNNEPDDVPVIVLNQDGTATFPGTGLPQAKYSVDGSQFLATVQVYIDFTPAGRVVKLGFTFDSPSVTDKAVICSSCKTYGYERKGTYQKK